MAVQPTEHSPLHNLEEEGKLSYQEAAPVTDDTDQMFSEEQSYRETVRSVRLFKISTLVPHQLMITLFARPRTQQAGKISIKLPTDNGLIRKLEKSNITLTEGYSSKTSKASGLPKNKFLKPQGPRISSMMFTPSDQPPLVRLL